jgi:cytochrome b
MSGLSPFAQAELEAAVADGDWSVLVEEDGDAEGESESLYGDVLEEVHEVAANLIVILAFLHVAGVVVESRVLRRNLVAPMLMARRGRKG